MRQNVPVLHFKLIISTLPLQGTWAKQMEKRRKPLLLVLLVIYLLCMVNGTLLESSPPLHRKHFVLIHGSCHGAWSWYKILTLLKSSGHNVTAIDLAASGTNMQQVNTLRSISDYHQPLMDFMEALPSHEKVILVGHSLGGLALSQAMERFSAKISVAVFVTALMPGPMLNISTLNQVSSRYTGSLMDSRYTYDNGPNNPPTTLVFGPLFLQSKLYQNSPIEDWALATTLMRPVRLFSEEDLSKVIVLTNKKYGSVDRVFIISDKDKVVKKVFQQWMVKENPPNEIVEILGSDHMVMMSKPRELWAHLLGIARKYN